MSTLTTAILSALGGALATLIIGMVTGFFKWLKAIVSAVKAVTHDALFRQCRSILANGEKTENEMENLDHLYEAYHGLKMNGTGEEMYKRCKNIPLSPDCEK